MKKSKTISILIVLAVLASVFIWVFFFAQNDKPVTKDGYYFDTYVSFTVYSAKDSRYLDECLKMCERYEKLFSRTVDGSDISNINNANGSTVTVDEETYYLLERALEFCEKTDGAADITVAPLSDLWGFSHDSLTSEAGFTNREFKPSEDELKKTLENIDYNCVVLEGGNKVHLENPEAKVDLGFIAKGYIADKLKEYLTENGVKSAIISLGGNIVLIGSKPDGSEFNIGIKDPEDSGEIISSVKAIDKSVVTSGTYERYVIYDKEKYHHILNTQTGYPVDNGIKSVTVISDSSLEGDALSTICLILGEDKAQGLLKEYNAEAVFY